MSRLIAQRISLLLLVNSLLIALALSIGNMRYQTLVLFGQTSMTGFLVYDAQTQGIHQLIPIADLNLTYITAPAWSLDGETLAFVGRRTLTTDGLDVTDNLYISDANGRNPRLLWDTSGSPLKTSSQGRHTVRWSPDGEKIALYLDLYGHPHLWIVHRDGTLLFTTSSQAPFQENTNALPLNAQMLWSADSDTLYLVTMTDGIHYQTVSFTEEHLSDPVTLITGQGDPTSQIIIALSPTAAEIVRVINTDQGVLLSRITLETDTISTEFLAVDDITALTWLPSGDGLAWVTVKEGVSKIGIQTADGTITDYTLPQSIQHDRSYQLWLTENPLQIVVRMQRGSLCRNVGQVMRCHKPDVFSPTWYGVRP